MNYPHSNSCLDFHIKRIHIKTVATSLGDYADFIGVEFSCQTPKVGPCEDMKPEARLRWRKGSGWTKGESPSVRVPSLK